MPFDLKQLYGAYRPVTAVSVSIAGVGSTLVAAEDYTRRVLVIWCSTSTNVTLSTRSSVTSTTGMILTANAPSLILNSWDHGPLVGVAWWGAGAVGAVVEVLAVQEVIDPDVLSALQRGAIPSDIYSAQQGNGRDNGRVVTPSKPTARWTDPQSAPVRRIRNLVQRRGGAWEWDQDSSWDAGAETDDGGDSQSDQAGDQGDS